MIRIQGILESAGYRVKTAVDGLEAFTLLRSENFDLVVSEVEMPRLGGLDLTARIRADKKIADLPCRAHDDLENVRRPRTWGGSRGERLLYQEPL